MAEMVDNEVRVATRSSGRDPWFALDADDVPWLREVEAIPAVLDASTIARLLGVSRPTSYEIIARCQPIRIGRLVRCLGQDFKAYLERQRVGE